MANTTAQLILEAGTREPTQRLGFGLRLGNAPESPAPTTVTYRYPVICDCTFQYRYTKYEFHNNA